MIERTLKASHNHETLNGAALRITNEAGEPLALDGVIDVATFTDDFCIIMRHKTATDGEVIMDASGVMPEMVFLMGNFKVEVLPRPGVEEALLHGEPTEDRPPVGLLSSQPVV